MPEPVSMTVATGFQLWRLLWLGGDGGLDNRTTAVEVASPPYTFMQSKYQCAGAVYSVFYMRKSLLC